MVKCNFNEPWIGRCKNEKPCPKHDTKYCWYCGYPATSGCSIAGSLVCGAPQCDEHKHSSVCSMMGV
jgi:hypothetical protein